MSDLNPKPTTIELNGETFPLFMSINVIDAIQSHFDIEIEGLADVLSDKKRIISNLKHILSFMINDAIDFESETGANKRPHVTPDYIGRRIAPNKIGYIKDAIYQIFIDAMPMPEDTGPNA